MQTSANWYYSEIMSGFRKPALVSIAIALSLLHVTYFLLLKLNLAWFAELTREDGVLENASALLFFLAGVAFLLGAIAAKDNVQRIWALLFAVALIFMAGEEISWGQRIFDLQWDSLQEINSQGETNLHNLSGVNTGRLLSLGSLVIGALLPLMLLLSDRVRRIAADVLKFPLPHPLVSLAFLLSYLWYKSFHSGPPDSPLALSVQESREFSIAVGCVLYPLIWTRLQSVGRAFRVVKR